MFVHVSRACQICGHGVMARAFETPCDAVIFLLALIARTHAQYTSVIHYCQEIEYLPA